MLDGLVPEMSGFQEANLAASDWKWPVSDGNHLVIKADGAHTTTEKDRRALEPDF